MKSNISQLTDSELIETILDVLVRMNERELALTELLSREHKKGMADGLMKFSRV